MYNLTAAKAWLPELFVIAQEAGEILKTYFNKPELANVMTKADDTVVSAADIAASECIVAKLKALTPTIPIVSEEDLSCLTNNCESCTDYWLVDPLDGTRGFLDQLEEFCINIALVVQGQAVLGLIYMPMQGIHYYALKGEGAFRMKNGQAERLPPRQQFSVLPYKIVIGHYHNSRRVKSELEGLMDCEIYKVNSAYKFALIADGSMDVYPRLGPTSFWDTAAGQILIEETGGLVVDFNGQPLQYKPSRNMLNPGFLAIAQADSLDEMLSIFQDIRRK